MPSMHEFCEVIKNEQLNEFNKRKKLLFNLKDRKK